MKFAAAFLVFACAVLFAAPGRADDLHYFKNYFVTGDYTVAGVGLFGKGVNGLATGQINMPAAAPGVPAGADIVAAFLYWQSVETTTTPSSTNGTFDGNAIVGAVLGNTPAPACWSQGGTSPQVNARVYRVDVLRYLPVVNNVRVASGMHTVILPDSGSTLMSVTPHTEGASLLVIYRILQPGGAPYKAVVIYDGASTMSKMTAAFSQIMGGFYQASGTGAKMTHIVGNGQPNFATQVTTFTPTTKVVENNILVGAQGTRWDNPTFNINLPANASQLTTEVVAQNNQVCLSWGAVVMSTNVVDLDGDGLLDIWESKGLHLNPGTPGKAAVGNTPAVPAVAATFGTCADYPNDAVDPCENFPQMGAKNGVKDVFVQIDWMQGTDISSGGAGFHVHAPKLAALQMIANVFKPHNIAMHFDVGNNYQQNPALPYIIPAAYARGGNVIKESAVECPPNPIPNGYVPPAAGCTFSSVSQDYSVLGWKVGFNAIENGYPFLGIPPNFAHDRKDTFVYVLFGHALAVPAVINPALPGSVSGVADTPGSDVFVSLGLWRTTNPAKCTQFDATGINANICTDETGTTQVQAGTLMHEMGHTWGLYHGGAYKLPNCMPNYPSVMNYLYQTRGLTDAAGNEHIDFSLGALSDLNESSLSETKSLGTMTYRIRYYAPPNAAQSAANSAQQTYYCDGSLQTGAEPAQVRLETPGVQIPDWDNDNNGNSETENALLKEDINFNGTIGSVTADSVEPGDTNSSDPHKLWFVDYNDWANLNLQQIGARLNVDGLSADVNSSDLSAYDLGQSSLGQSSLGQSSLGQSSLGDTAQSDQGQSSLGQSSLGDPNYDTAVSTLDPTGTATPLVETNTATIPANGYNQITLNWGPPSLGIIVLYSSWRTNEDASPLNTVMGPVSPGTPPPTTISDLITDMNPADFGAHCPADPCFNTNYQYYITSKGSNNVVSTPSNVVTANVRHIFVSAVSPANVTYGNTIPAISVSITGQDPNGVSPPPAGTVTPSCAYYSQPYGPGSVAVTPRNVGTYTIHCGGVMGVGTNTTDGVTYIDGALTITARPLTIVAQPNTKTYDGTTRANAEPKAAPAVPNVSGLVNPDSFFAAETYDNVNAGMNKMLAVTQMSIVISDGNNGNNYILTTQTSAAGVINQAPLTLAAVTDSKTYDSTMASSAMPTVTGLVGATTNGDTVTGLAEMFRSKNVLGTGMSTLSVSAYSVNDGNMGGNYSLIFTNAAGTITPRSLFIAAQPNTKVYDGNTSALNNMTNSLTVPMVLGPSSGTGLAGNPSPDSVTNLVETYVSANVSNNDTLSVTAYIVNDGNGGKNYLVTLNTAVGTITQRSLTIAAQPNTKIYDSTPFALNNITNALTTPVVLDPPNGMGLATGDGVTGLAETYAGVNVNPLATLSVSSYTVNDHNGGNNYAVTLNIAVGSITQRSLTIAAQSNTKVYDGTTSALNDVTSSLTVPVVAATTTTTGLVGTDTVTNLAETYASAGVSLNDSISVSPSYSVNDGVGGGDYSVTLQAANGVITAAPLTAAVTGTESAASPSFTANPLTQSSYTGFVNGEQASAVITGTLSCAVVVPNGGGTAGQNPISCEGLSAANYNISYDYSALSPIVAATPAPLTVNVSGTVSIVSTTPTFTLSSFTYSGFVNGDSPSVVIGTLTCQASATADTAGNYPISCSGLSSANYVITYSYSPGAGTAPAQAPLTVAVSGTVPSGMNSTAPLSNVSLTYTGFINGDTLSVVTGTLSCTVDTTINPFVLSCSGLGAPAYYTIYYLPGTITVGQ